MTVKQRAKHLLFAELIAINHLPSLITGPYLATVVWGTQRAR